MEEREKKKGGYGKNGECKNREDTSSKHDPHSLVERKCVKNYRKKVSKQTNKKSFSSKFIDVSSMVIPEFYPFTDRDTPPGRSDCMGDFSFDSLDK